MAQIRDRDVAPRASEYVRRLMTKTLPQLDISNSGGNNTTYRARDWYDQRTSTASISTFFRQANAGHDDLAAFTQWSKMGTS